jgi:type IV pilus assembly protein PilN
MIKINLLPVRAAKKKETTRQQISILIITVAGTVIACVLLYSMAISKISNAKEDISKTEQEIQQLKTKIGEIDNIKKLQADVKKKLDILSRLRKEKSGPVRRLALLSNAVPDKLWLTKYTEAAGAISISGVAFSEDDIASFMKSLQAIPDFSNVELLVSEQTEINKIKAKRFDINFKLAAFASPEPDKAVKK